MSRSRNFRSFRVDGGGSAAAALLPWATVLAAIVVLALLREDVALAALLALPVAAAPLWLAVRAVGARRTYFNGRVFAQRDWAGRLEGRLHARDLEAMTCRYDAGLGANVVELAYRTRGGESRVLRFRESVDFPFRQLVVAIEVTQPHVAIRVDLARGRGAGVAR